MAERKKRASEDILRTAGRQRTVTALDISGSDNLISQASNSLTSQAPTRARIRPPASTHQPAKVLGPPSIDRAHRPPPTVHPVTHPVHGSMARPSRFLPARPLTSSLLVQRGDSLDWTYLSSTLPLSTDKLPGTLQHPQ